MTKSIEVSDEIYMVLVTVLEQAEGVETINDVINSLLYLANMKNEDYTVEKLKLDGEKEKSKMMVDPSYM